MNSTRIGLLLFVGAVLVALSLGAAGVVAQVPGQADEGGTEQVVGSPNIQLSAADNRLTPGETQTLEIQLSNSGDITRAGSAQLEDRVKTARSVEFGINERRLADGIEARSGSVLVGTLPEGAGQPISFTFDVDDDIESGTYNIPVEVEYRHTRLAERTAGGLTRYRDRTRTERIDVEVVVEDDSFFSVSPVSSDVVAGDTGDFEVELENTGSRTARSPRITFSSGEAGIFFGALEERREAKTVGADDIEPDESRTVTVSAGASSDTDPASYPVDIDVRYETDGGVERVSRTMTTLLDTRGEQEFVTEGVESSLRVGDDGDLTGEIRNEGPRPVENAVVQFEPASRNIDPKDTEYAIGSLGVGESAEFDFRVSVSSEADRGPRKSDIFVEYRNADGDRRASTAVDLNYDVAERLDEFELDTDVSLAAGSSGDIEVEVTNIKDETFTDIQAKMFTDSPLDSDDDEAFIPQLEPGESETIIFDLSAASGATAKTYSSSVDFRYDNERGDTKISETYRVPVSVTPAEESDNTALILVVLLLALLAGVGWWKRDSLRSSGGTEE